MNTGVRLGLYGAGLVLVFGAAFGLGRLAAGDDPGPAVPAPAPSASEPAPSAGEPAPHQGSGQPDTATHAVKEE